MEENNKFDNKSLKKVTGRTADFEELSKDCVAFANSHGGYLAIGIEDGEDKPAPGQRITDDLPEKIIKRINELTINVALRPEIIDADNGGQYMKLHVLPSQVSIASTTKGVYYIRDHDSSRPLLPDELSRLITDKPAYSWETKVSLKIQWQKADISKLNKFVLDIRSSDRVSQFVKEKSDEELLSYYQMIDDDGYLTNLGVLWIGKQEQRARLLYSPIVQYIKYDTEERKVDKKVWSDYSLNPQELLITLWESIPDWREYNEVSEGLWRKELPVYDEKVVRELLCNAIVHRPYTTRGDIFIKLYPDRMTITNPGVLPIGVTVNNILQKTEKRNIHLANVFYDLHLMEAEGSGYDLIYETLLTTGKCKPVVYEGEDYVEVTVYKKIVSKESSRICDFVSANYKISQKAYISLGIILQKKSVTTGELSKELQLIDGSRLRPYVESLIANNIILHKGSGRGTKYEINPEFVSSTKMQFPTTLKTIEPYRLKALILEDLKYHSNSLLSEMATRLPDVDFTELEKMVRTMAKDGEITPIGGRKYRRYKLNEDSFLEKSGRK
ncbi:MAG: ATP-dependent DNA helicase RecG [bacterium P3]|nr:MAG: ATP-dependent DNA helicase RecG [bacterium P3]KWW38685.1 MAG: ATP-dependent DNA helicase RecG [bacterium F083]